MRSDRQRSAHLRRSTSTRPRRSLRSAITIAVASLAIFASGSCADADADHARRALIVDTIVRADLPLLRTRPTLVAGKYARMARGLFDFYRGTFPLFVRDAREGSSPASASTVVGDVPLVDGIGDAHPENFALLRASDGSFALEPNDFDGADRYPFLWEIRRLAAGMVLASRLSNPTSPAARTAAIEAERACARAVASTYADEIVKYANGTTPPRFSTDEGFTYVADLFRRALRDAPLRGELTDLTVLEGDRRRLIRGSIDPTDPENTYADLPRWAIDEIPATLARYRDTLTSPPPAEYFRVYDAVREFGSGVASWPRVRVIVLVRGPTDSPSDDVLIELKELSDSGVGGWFPPGVPADSVQERIELELRSAWSRPDADPLWGTSTWLGFPVQIRTESDAFKNVRISRLEDKLGSPETIAGLARALGAKLARIHAQSRIDGTRPSVEIAHIVAANPASFADEQADAAVKIADVAQRDWALFREAYASLGPSLGVPFDAADRGSSSLDAIYGDPPAVQPVPSPP